MTAWLAAIYHDGQFPAPMEVELVPVLHVKNARGGRAGFKQDVEAKLAIEKHAVATVWAYLRELGYPVRDVGDTESFDLDAHCGSERLRVEVKGTTTSGQQVILTKAEVALHKTAFPDNALGIVRGINLDLQTDPPQASGGELVWISPWQIQDEALDAIAYWYATGL